MEDMIFGIVDDIEGMSYENDFIVIITTKETWENENRIDDGSEKYPIAYDFLKEHGFVDVMEGHYDAQLQKRRSKNSFRRKWICS